MTLKLISWNVAGRKGKHAEQAERLLSAKPDIVALQEVRDGMLDRWVTALQRAGMAVEHSRDRMPDGHKNFNLVAVRGTVEKLAPTCSEFPQLLLSTKCSVAGTELELHNAHVANGSTYGLGKIVMLEEIYERMGEPRSDPRILCGDFNLPKSESPAGEIDTWAGRHRRHFERWEAAELRIMPGLSNHGLDDCFRHLHGYKKEAFSWYPNSGKNRKGRRFDHVFATADASPQTMLYLDDWRASGLSDHAAVETVFGL